MEILLDAIISGIMMGLIFALVALGLTIIFGVMDVVNFAHGEFLMLGMYTAYWSYAAWGLDPLISLPLCAAGGILVGVLSYYLLVRRLLKGPVVAQLFGTFGLMLFIRYLAQFLWGSANRSVDQGLLVGKSIALTDTLVISLAKLFPALISIAAFLAVSYLINRTRVGKALKATALDAEAAGYMGIDADKMNALAWAIGGGTVGLAGGLLTNFWATDPYIGMLFVMIAFAAVALGGFGSLKGAFVAGVLIGLLETLVGLVAPSYKFTAVYATYFLVVVFRPEGLFGWKR